MVNMVGNVEIGKTGENIAYEYLKNKGYLILARNYREKWGEIDIIAQAPDSTLVFVEVKTLQIESENSSIAPEDNLTQAKLKKLRRTCDIFANSKYCIKFINEKMGWRIDLITVSMSPDYFLTKNINNCIINHYQNI